jgi:hypothetical protein
METKEKKNNDDKDYRAVEFKWKMPEMMEKCCEVMSENSNCSSMMAMCMNSCKWFPLMAVMFGIALFLLGYYLDAEVTRILWMIGAILSILMGTFCFVMMRK